MDIYPAYLLLVLVAFIIYKIYKNINDANSHHIYFLFYHFLCQLILIVNFAIFLKFGLAAPSHFIMVLRVLTLLFLYLHLKSVLQQSRATIKKIDIVLVFLIVAIDVLNSIGVQLTDLQFKPIIDGHAIKLGVNYFFDKTDLFLYTSLIIFYYSFLIIKTFLRIKNDTLVSENVKTILYKWGYVYISLFILSNLFLIFNFVLHLIELEAFNLFQKIISISAFLLPIFIPSLLHDIASIRVKTQTELRFNEFFEKIEEHFNTSEHYLDPKYSITKLVLNLNLRSDIIRNSIKENTQMTVPFYINSYRIKYARKQIKEGYLVNFSMEALSIQSGFSSQQTFNRSFKSICNQTPSEFVKFLNQN